MKKKILGGIAILALAFTIGINLNLTKTTKGIALKNIEALAQGEGGGFTCRWATRDSSETQVICIRSGAGSICTCGDVKNY